MRYPTDHSAVRTDFGVLEPRTAYSKASSGIQDLPIPSHTETADLTAKLTVLIWKTSCWQVLKTEII